jgi:hypothetical protein
MLNGTAIVPPAEPSTKPNILHKLMENPVVTTGWKMTRDEMHDR